MTLAERIAALAAENPQYEGAARVLSTRGGAAEAIIEEMNQTVLGSKLLFESDEASLGLLVVGRRLVSIESVSGIDAPADLLGTELSMDGGDQVAQVSEVIKAFAEAAKSLRVTSVSKANVDTADSLSLQALQAAMGLDVDDPGASPLQRFMTRIDAHAAASLQLEDGAVTKTQGSIQLVQGLKIALSTQLSTFLDSRQATCPSHADPSLTLCQDTVGPGVGMAIAVHGSEIALVAFRADGLAEICSAWQRVA